MPTRLGQPGLLKERLDQLYAAFDLEHVVSDPIWIVRRFRHPADREVVGFCAAALAFGRVQSVINSIEALVAVMGDRPAEYVRRFEPEVHGAALFPLVHRWTRGVDLVALLWLLRQMLERGGSLAECCAVLPDRPELVGDDAGRPWGAWSTAERRALALAAWLVHLRNRSFDDLPAAELDRQLHLVLGG